MNGGPYSGFNGAAAARPRKFAVTVSAGQFEFELQWGRGRSAAEIPQCDGPMSRRENKLQWGRGRSAAEMVVVNDYLIRSKYASMGPRPIGRGNVNHLTDPFSR